MNHFNLILTLLLITLSSGSFAANRFWVANSTGNWTDPNNWSTTSGGGGGASVPGITDDVFFNNLRVGNCTINSVVSIASLTVSSGYSGTITQGSLSIFINGIAQFSGGTFTGGTGTFNTTALTISGGAFNANSTINVAGDLTISSGVLTVIGANTINIEGNWSNYSSTTGFIENSSTISFNGSSAQAITTTGGEIFHNITIAGGGTKFLNENVTVNGSLSFINGLISTSSFMINISSTGSVSGGSSGNYVRGNLQKYFSAGSNVNRTFEVGAGSNYMPLTITFPSVSVAGSLIVSISAGDHPLISLSTCFDANNSVNNYWTVTNAGVTGTNYSATFQFTNASYDASANPNEFGVQIYQGGSWTNTSTAARTSNSISISGITSYGDFQIAEVGQGLWNGNVSSDWNNIGNWCGAIPSTTTDVTINSDAVNMPVINGTANCHNLIITSNASLSNAGTLNITGNFTNNGTYTDNGNSIFNGASAQLINGSNLLFNNITINNGDGVSVNDATLVKGVITLTVGELNSNGNLFLNLNTGLISGEGAGTISGNISVSKSVNSPSWHYLSIPLNGITAAQINEVSPLTNGFYSYDETVALPHSDYGWAKITDTGTPLDPTKGYTFKFPTATTIDFTGAYNHLQGDITINASNTPSSEPTADGWNFIGNPYPSPLDWEQVTLDANVENAIYMWDPVLNKRASYVSGAGTNSATQFIPSVQGFHIHATGTPASITFNNEARVTTPNGPSLRKASSETLLRLKISSGLFADEAIIRVLPEATDHFDKQYDAYKMMNGGSNPSLYTNYNGTLYSINSIQEPASEKIIPLKIDAAITGQHTLSIDIPAQFPYKVLLLDQMKKVFQDLNQESTYTADLTAGDTAQRFFVHLLPDAITGLAEEISIFHDDNSLDIVFNNPNHTKAKVEIFSTLGIPVYHAENENKDATSYQIDLKPFATGIYIVKVQMDNRVYSRKIYKR